MKNKITIIIIILFITILTSCDKVARFYTQSYIQSYWLIEGVLINQTTADSTPIPSPNPDPDYYYTIDDPRFNIKFIHSNYVSFLSSGDAKKEYDKLCAKNKDQSYNKTVMFVPKGYGDKQHYDRYGFYPSIVSIDVTSDKDYDDTHPAGTKLNDNISVKYSGAYSYISTNYNDYYITTPTPYKPLNEFSEQDFCALLANGGLTNESYGWASSDLSLFFTKLPDKIEMHKITVAVTCDDGSVFEASRDYDFAWLINQNKE